MEAINEAQEPVSIRSTLEFPELLTLKNGDVATYDLEFVGKVRAAVMYLKRKYGIKLDVRSNSITQEVKVFLKR